MVSLLAACGISEIAASLWRFDIRAGQMTSGPPPCDVAGHMAKVMGGKHYLAGRNETAIGSTITTTKDKHPVLSYRHYNIAI
jgi:hypothetical protein